MIGLTNGLIIALIAIGYTLVYGILELINFAHADVFMLGHGVHLLRDRDSSSTRWASRPASTPALLLTFARPADRSCSLTAVINASIERVAYRPLRNAPRLAPLISAIGMSFVLQNIGLVLLGPSQRAVEPILPKDGPRPLPERRRVVRHRRAHRRRPSPSRCCSLLRWFVASTRQGKAMRATAQDREASGLMGIDVNRTISLTFLIAGALAGAAGLVVALYYGQTCFQFGFQFGLLSFTAAVLGGIGNLTGATARRRSSSASSAPCRTASSRPSGRPSSCSAILILVLVFRPTGLLAEKQSERA